jgi:hypothetical protein
MESALILFQFFLCIGNAGRVRSSPTIRAEVLHGSRIPSDEMMLHGVSVKSGSRLPTAPFRIALWRGRCDFAIQYHESSQAH